MIRYVGCCFYCGNFRILFLYRMNKTCGPCITRYKIRSKWL